MKNFLELPNEVIEIVSEKHLFAVRGGDGSSSHNNGKNCSVANNAASCTSVNDGKKCVVVNNTSSCTATNSKKDCSVIGDVIYPKPGLPTPILPGK